MKYIGYHRTSTTDQHLDRGIKEIEDYCIQNNLSLKKIYTDQQTGKNFNRPRYTVMKEDVLEPSDVLIITELDRLGRNKRDTLKELQHFKDNDVRVMIIEIPTTLIDYSKFDNTMAAMLMETVNNLLIEIYASFAQAEMEKREKRQREGIASMKARGDWNRYGRPNIIDSNIFVKEYEKVLSGELRPVDVMNKLNLKKPTYYKYRKQYEDKRLGGPRALKLSKVIAIVNVKGGSGKTLLAKKLVSKYEENKKVLAVDADKQENLYKDHNFSSECIKYSDLKNINRREYDMIFIDCEPNLSGMVKEVIQQADYYFIPIMIRELKNPDYVKDHLRDLLNKKLLSAKKTIESGNLDISKVILVDYESMKMYNFMSNSLEDIKKLDMIENNYFD